MRMCQNDLLAMKAMNNQDVFTPHGSIFLQATALSMWQSEQPVNKSLLDRQQSIVGDSDLHRRNNGIFATVNQDMRSMEMMNNFNGSPVITSQTMTAFLPRSSAIECSSNKNRCASNGNISCDLSTAINHIATVDYFPQSKSSPTSGSVESNESKMPSKLPFCLAQPVDKFKLSEHQLFLRFQIEAFAATEDDVNTHIRGRNKRIILGQVGIRCRHCAHLPASRRQKGAAYFPANTMGLYQAAQNMSTAHIQCGLCPEMPEYIKEHFKGLIATKSFTSGAGRPYWAKSAKKIGLVNTEDGIRFIHDIPEGTALLEDGEILKLK